MPDFDAPRNAPAENETALTAYFLAGPTASGKSAVAEWIAEREGFSILSADSMMVYRGMDVGTAKPDAGVRSRLHYFGLDITTPDREFNAWEFCRYAHSVIASESRTVVVGGTGLYFKGLTHGLDFPWAEAEQNVPFPCLRRSREDVRSRIEDRALAMYRMDGLVAESRALLETYGSLSATAMKAIGYAEAVDLIQGRCSEEEAIRRTVSRTVKLAKHQRTWFRHQLRVDWLDVERDATVEQTARAVMDCWKRHGPTRIAFGLPGDGR